MNTSKNIKAIIGLGNPGTSYYKTRHNIGFRVLDALAEKHMIPWKIKDTMEHCEIVIEKPPLHHTMLLIKPRTFMNDSGKIIPSLVKKGIKAEEIMVIHDELEKPFGSMSIKQGGSARGHNGLRSIISVLGDNFWRLRFGIGRPLVKEEVPHFVLAPFSKEEEEKIVALLEEAIQKIDFFI